MSNTNGVSRRDALRTIGSGAVGLSAMGVAAGNEGNGQDDDRVTVTIGYDRPSGERAARNRADEVVYDFAFDALTIEVDEHAVDVLRQRGDVRYVERDREYEAIAQTLPYGIDRVDAEVAHAAGDAGSGADVAIVDTGIDATHPDLAANLGTGTSFIGGVQNPDWQDDNGHGTHCAGIADAIDNDRGVVGVATEATLHAVKVLTASGVGLTSDIAAGVEWVAEQGYDVASMSLGGSTQSEALADACTYAHEQGVTLVAAAGNSGPCTDCVGYPAANPEPIAVSATDENDQFASFSSQGLEVEIAAPGADIYSTYLGGYSTLSGTSMACPHVSGAAVQLAAQGYSNTEIRRRLKNTAEDIGLADTESGAGLLDVASALGHTSGDDL
ncbi:S8 family peptidase [Halorarius litoreus]|uniref:S8 family peptidase n=1 Tax=Halorarius litoreus TaxID=2962676 RepID=UPI0020CEDDFC|nr:S8 family peptidase [Halorarius litoreus]